MNTVFSLKLIAQKKAQHMNHCEAASASVDNRPSVPEKTPFKSAAGSLEFPRSKHDRIFPDVLFTIFSN